MHKPSAMDYLWHKWQSPYEAGKRAVVMRNSWLDTYTGGEEKGPDIPQITRPSAKKLANIAIASFAVVMISGLIGGSVWLQMKDNEQREAAASHIAQAFSRSQKQAASLINKTMGIPAESLISEDEEILALQSVSDLTAEDEGSRLDPFSPLISGPGEIGFDPTKPKDILDGVSFTGFINDVSAKGKVAIIRIDSAGGGSTSMVKKIGEAFYVDGEKIMVKDIKSNTLYLGIGGGKRQLPLSPYVDTVLAKGGGSSGSSGGGVGAPAGSIGTPADSTIQLEEL